MLAAVLAELQVQPAPLTCSDIQHSSPHWKAPASVPMVSSQPDTFSCSLPARLTLSHMNFRSRFCIASDGSHVIGAFMSADAAHQVCARLGYAPTVAAATPAQRPLEHAVTAEPHPLSNGHIHVQSPCAMDVMCEHGVLVRVVRAGLGSIPRAGTPWPELVLVLHELEVVAVAGGDGATSTTGRAGVPLPDVHSNAQTQSVLRRLTRTRMLIRAPEVEGCRAPGLGFASPLEVATALQLAGSAGRVGGDDDELIPDDFDAGLAALTHTHTGVAASQGVAVNTSHASSGAELRDSGVDDASQPATGRSAARIAAPASASQNRSHDSHSSRADTDVHVRVARSVSLSDSPHLQLAQRSATQTSGGTQIGGSNDALGAAVVTVGTQPLFSPMSTMNSSSSSRRGVNASSDDQHVVLLADGAALDATQQIMPTASTPGASHPSTMFAGSSAYNSSGSIVTPESSAQSVPANHAADASLATPPIEEAAERTRAEASAHTLADAAAALRPVPGLLNGVYMMGTDFASQIPYNHHDDDDVLTQPSAADVQGHAHAHAHTHTPPMPDSITPASNKQLPHWIGSRPHSQDFRVPHSTQSPADDDASQSTGEHAHTHPRKIPRMAVATPVPSAQSTL